MNCNLTTEHSASSYGVPVLLRDGVAYGPDDIMPHECSARDTVRYHLADYTNVTAKFIDSAERFLGRDLSSLRVAVAAWHKGNCKRFIWD